MLLRLSLKLTGPAVLDWAPHEIKTDAGFDRAAKLSPGNWHSPSSALLVSLNELAICSVHRDHIREPCDGH